MNRPQSTRYNGELPPQTPTHDMSIKFTADFTIYNQSPIQPSDLHGHMQSPPSKEERTGCPDWDSPVTCRQSSWGGGLAGSNNLVAVWVFPLSVHSTSVPSGRWVKLWLSSSHSVVVAVAPPPSPACPPRSLSSASLFGRQSQLSNAVPRLAGRRERCQPGG